MSHLIVGQLVRLLTPRNGVTTAHIGHITRTFSKDLQGYVTVEFTMGHTGDRLPIVLRQYVSLTLLTQECQPATPEEVDTHFFAPPPQVPGRELTSEDLTGLFLGSEVYPEMESPSLDILLSPENMETLHYLLRAQRHRIEKLKKKNRRLKRRIKELEED